MCKKQIKTSTAEKTIWKEVLEDNFRQNLVALEERTNAVPVDPEIFSIDEWCSKLPEQHNVSRYLLPIEIEQQLADNFACIAAVEQGAQSVAAVCIEQCIANNHLTFRFAALDLSLSIKVRETLAKISDILSRVTTTSEAAAVPLVEEMFREIVQLHHHRLLGRLRSSKWEKPIYLSRTHKKPLWKDFPNLIHRAEFLYQKKERDLRAGVEGMLGELALEYEKFENLSEIEVSSRMLLLVEKTFVFCSKGEVKNFVERLERSAGKIPTPQVASALKCLRQIEKIAAYRRICISLVQVATKYPNLFQNGIKIEYLTPYESIPTNIGYEDWAKTCHVHAEIQLAVWYDLSSGGGSFRDSFLLPRCIGISKWLCYLCYLFLQAHSKFFPSRTHGRLYDQWTVPDLEEFNDAERSHYQTILVDINREILRRIENEPEIWRLEPMTSMEIPGL